MKRLLLGAALLLSLTACYEPEVSSQDDKVVPLEDGTQIRCLLIGDGAGQSSTMAASCDWVRYHEEFPGAYIPTTTTTVLQ